MGFDSYLSSGLLQLALLGGLLAAPAAGMVGAVMVSRRMGYLAGAVSHFVLGGVGFVSWLSANTGLGIDPLWGAYVSALFVALLMGQVFRRSPEKEDTISAGLWAFGMAVGVVFLALTPGYSEDLMTYLFGNILLVGRSEFIALGALDLVLVAASVLFYRRVVLTSFDEEFARIQGVRVGLYYNAYLVAVAVTVVLLSRVVGIILVIALLALPAAMALRFTRRLWASMLLGTLFAAVASSVGIVLSFWWNLPSGAVIILVLSAAYALVALLARGRPPRPPVQPLRRHPLPQPSLEPPLAECCEQHEHCRRSPSGETSHMTSEQ